MKFLCRVTASLGVLACVAAAVYGAVRLCMLIPYKPPQWMVAAGLVPLLIMVLAVVCGMFFAVGQLCWEVGCDVCDRLNEWKRDRKGGR